MGKKTTILSNINFEVANTSEREAIVSIVNSVTSENIHLQSDRYIPTPAWEELLREGLNLENGLALFVVKYKEEIIGFGRLSPDGELGRCCGNVGIVLLKPFRSKGIGTALLGLLIDYAPYLGYVMMTANILAVNTVSLRLFSHHGFIMCEHHNVYLPQFDQEQQEYLYILNLPRRDNHGFSPNS